MAVILKSPITGPAAWRGADVGTASAWTHHLTPTQIALMDQALDTLATSGHRYPSFSKEHFPIEPLGPLLAWGLAGRGHSRNAFVDDEDPAQRREMLRLWLKMPNARALAPEFPGRNGFPAVANG
jgi:hypothetical protein